jgi:calcineurin-like phosphoesterase
MPISDPFMETTDRLLRPANYPPARPGWLAGVPSRRQATLCRAEPARAHVHGGRGLSVSGRRSDPRPVAGDVPVRLLDFPAEATSEKRALAFACDGRITACAAPIPTC